MKSMNSSPIHRDPLSLATHKFYHVSGVITYNLIFAGFKHLKTSILHRTGKAYLPDPLIETKILPIDMDMDTRFNEFLPTLIDESLITSTDFSGSCKKW